jgi:hypothetical protein
VVKSEEEHAVSRVKEGPVTPSRKEMRPDATARDMPPTTKTSRPRWKASSPCTAICSRV